MISRDIHININASVYVSKESVVESATEKFRVSKSICKHMRIYFGSVGQYNM